MNHDGLMNDRAYSLDAITKQDLQRMNPMNYMQHTTRGKVWDVAHDSGLKLDTMDMMVANAKYVARCMDALAPMIEQHGAGLPIVLDALNQNGAKTPVADPAVDAFDRLIEFTLYCAPTNVACVMDWCTATSVVEKFVVEDDRAGTGTWTIKFTANGAEVIDALSRMAREHQIDVHMNMLAGG